MTETTDEIIALEHAYDDLTRLVSNIGIDDLAKPTNCPGWDVRALLNHTLGTATMFTLVNAGQAADEDAGDLVGNDPAAALAQARAANLAAWRREGALDGDRTYPWGTFPAGVGLVINVSEIAVHGWDVARATSQAATVDADAARIVYGLYRQMPMDGLRAHGVFGAEVEVPAAAPVQDRLLGVLGRSA
ncbi:MAG: TIGR03086 family protein [Acidimicrobiia bacterium]|nr:TIGR03086 family protein [Acidimicrobiia bacterium]